MSTTVHLSKLWDEACLGQQQAYNLLHKQLFTELYNYLSHMTRDRELANDLVQDLFIKIWIKRQSIGPVLNVKAYFFSAARLLFINHYNKQKRQQSQLNNNPVDDFEQSIENKITEREADQHFQTCFFSVMGKLPRRQREMVYMRYFQEMDYEDIANATGLKYQSVVNHVFRAVQVMRTEFKGLSFVIPLRPAYNSMNQAS